jgi:RHS repeat-associated protein
MRARRFLPLIAAFCAALAVGESAAAQTSSSNDARVQSPELAPPERASLAGQLAGVVFGPADVSRGAFTLPSPFEVPSDRGPLLASPFPSYAPEHGVSEWGIGWKASLEIARFRVSGSIDFAADDMNGTFGHMTRGSDSAFYPMGLARAVRVTHDVGADSLTAFTSDGTRLVFGGSARTIVAGKGTYAWHLVEARSVTGRKTRIDWSTNASGRLFPEAIWFGGIGDDFQYRIDVTYESLGTPFEDYRSGKLLVLDRRVSAVVVLAKNARTGAFEERWRYELSFESDGLGPGFRLASVQQVYRSGARPPASSYSYNSARERLAGTTLARNAKIDAALAAAPNLIQPDKSGSAKLDDDRDGLLDLEWAYDYRLFRQKDGAFVSEPLPPAPPGASLYCRAPVASGSNLPRLLVRLRSGVDDESHYVAHFRSDGGAGTYFTVCERSGAPYYARDASGTTLPYTQRLLGTWTPNATTRLVDLNRDHLPDLVRVQYGAFRVLPNTSTTSTFSFGAERTGSIKQAAGSSLIPFTPDTAWANDLNGDGIPDLVGRYSGGLVVWFGRGNFEFVEAGRTYQFRTLAGSPISIGTYALTFVDANKDGLSDALLTTSTGNQTSLFVNMGTPVGSTGPSVMQQIDVPGLKPLDSMTSKPVIADLSGSGNTEISFTRLGLGYGVALDGPETGLLAGADDGRGAALAFAYARAAASPGGGERQSVLASVTVTSSGTAPVAYRYDYALPELHDAGKFLLGYGEVTRTEPLGIEVVRFLHEERYAGVVLASSSRDLLVPGLERFSVRTYEEQAEFRGIPWKRLAAEESGWRAIDGGAAIASETTRYLAYWNDEICPADVERTTPAGTLTTRTTYASLAEFMDSLACLPVRVAQIGSHPAPGLDFHHETSIGRNEVGLVTEVSSMAPDGSTWTIQSVTYRPDRLIETISNAGSGTTTFSYDATTHLLARVVSPEGVVVEAVERDPLGDGLTALRTTRGALVHESFFTYDGEERLEKTWDDLGAGDAVVPDVRYAYRYASATTPATVTVSTLLDRATASVRTSMDLLGAGGALVGTAVRIPQGWSFGSLTWRDGTAGRTDGYVRGALAVSDPGSLEYGTLFDGASHVEAHVTGPSGATSDRRSWLHADVERHVQDAFWLDGGSAVRESTENGASRTTTALTASGRVVGYWDEAGTPWSYVYDALGRLREAWLPDGTSHRVGYDGHGRVSAVARDAIATVEYLYESPSGLVSEKRFRSPAGTLKRTVSYAHDAVGRVTAETHAIPGGTSKTFRFYYDGATPRSPFVADRHGLLTGVEGDGYTRTFDVHDDAGRVLRRTVEVGYWRTVVTEFAYNEAGEPRGSTVSVYAAGTHLLTTSVRDEFDAFGRPVATSLGGGPLADYGYDSEGLLAGVEFANGDVVGFSYDPLTRRLVGSQQHTPSFSAATSQRMNTRGLVESETLEVGATSLSRAYGYSAQRFLETSTDAASSHGYSFDPFGLSTRIVENGAARDIVRVGDTLLAGDLASRFDDLGRTIERGDLSLEYGPDGQPSFARSGAQTWSFVHDETGMRIAKLRNGAPVAAYVGDAYLDAVQLVQPVKFGNRAIGVLRNGVFETVATDLRGTVLAEPDGTPRLASPFGDRDVRPGIAAALDYVEKGFDADLGLVRMGVRDYDPDLNRFTTPDPLLLEQPEATLERPLEANLYGYAAGNPLRFVDPTGKYNELIHGLFTYELARLAGLPEDDAARFALGAASVDHDPATRPIDAMNIASGVTTEWHFNPSAPANFERIVAERPNSDLFELGRNFHAAQDWGFLGLGPHAGSQLGHPLRLLEGGASDTAVQRVSVWFNHYVDTPSHSPTAFRAEASQMFVQLVKLAQARGTGPTDLALVDKFDRLVETFLTYGPNNQAAVDERFRNTPNMTRSYEAQLQRMLGNSPVSWSPADIDRKQY